MKPNYSELCQQMLELSKKAAHFINQNRDKVIQDDIEIKSLNSLVSYVDKGAEEILVSGLKEILPEAGFIAEEGTETKRSENYNWIVDPLDGTTNFLHGIPAFAISVALAKKEEIVAGVIIELGQDESFYAWKGGGAYLNGNRISVNSTSQLKDTLVATGFPYYDFGRMEEFFRILKSFIKETRGVRRIGSAATDLAYVACGRFDGFFEYGLSPWDVAAGIILVKEAGGQVTDYSGGPNYLFDGEIAATSSAIHEEFMRVLQSS